MKYQEFKKAIDKPYFTNFDISFKKLNVYNYQLSLWQKKNYIGRLKRGLYFFTDEKEQLSAPEISFLLCQPSYLSMETMLSHYGLMPEIVYAQTAVTTKTTRKFSNSFGHFSYHKIKADLFFGYTPYQTEQGKYLMAEPEKAILDYFYFNLGKISGRNDILELRINGEELRRIIDRKKIALYLNEFKIKKLEKIINLLFEIC